MSSQTIPLVGIDADGHEDHHKVAILVLYYHLGRMVMACKVLGEQQRAKLASATERARSQAETLGGHPSTGPLSMGHMVDDEVLREMAVGLAHRSMRGQLATAAEIQNAVVEGAVFGVIKRHPVALSVTEVSASRIAA